MTLRTDQLTMDQVQAENLSYLAARREGRARGAVSANDSGQRGAAGEAEDGDIKGDIAPAYNPNVGEKEAVLAVAGQIHPAPPGYVEGRRGDDKGVGEIGMR